MAERGGIDSLNIVIGANTDALKKGLDNAVKAVQGGGEKIEQQSKRMAQAMDKWRKSADDAGMAATRKSRNLFNLAMAYEDMGQAGSKAMRDVLKEAGKLQDDLGTMKLAVEAATPEGRMKTMALGFSQLTSAIAGAQGAMHLLGVSSETAAEMTAKLQSFMAISQGVEQLVRLEDTMSALAKNIPLVNAAIKVFNVLIKPGPLLLIGAAATALYTIFSNLPGKIARVNHEHKAMTGLLDSMKTAVASEQAELVKLSSVLTSNAATLDQRRLAMRKLQEMHPAYFKGLDVEKSKHEDIAAAVNLATQAMREKAMAAAIEKRMTELASVEVEKTLALEKNRLEVAEARKKGETEWNKKKMEGTGILGELYAAQKEREELIKIANKIGADFTQSLSEGVEKGSGGTGGKPAVKKAVQSIQLQVLEEMRTMKSGAVSNIGGAPTVSLPLNVDFKTGDLTNKVGRLIQDINSALDSGIKNMALNMAGALSDLAMNIVAGAEQPLAKFGDALLSTLAGFMNTLGQAMISAGLASQTFQKVLFTQPALAIAAGAGLMVAAGVVKGIMQKGIEGRKSPGGGSGTGETPQGIRPFADGGIISGPTLGLMGEYPGARSNPEVVAPLNKLKDMIGGGGTLTTRISGQDLLIMLDRAETNRGRVR